MDSPLNNGNRGVNTNTNTMLGDANDSNQGLVHLGDLVPPDSGDDRFEVMSNRSGGSSKSAASKASSKHSSKHHTDSNSLWRRSGITESPPPKRSVSSGFGKFTRFVKMSASVGVGSKKRKRSVDTVTNTTNSAAAGIGQADAHDAKHHNVGTLNI